MLVNERITHAANIAYTSMCNMRTFFILPRNMCLSRYELPNLFILTSLYYSALDGINNEWD